MPKSICKEGIQKSILFFNRVLFTYYSLHKSPIRSAIFNPGETSRINVGDFMARLILDPYLWSNWQGQMPVIYNETDQPK
jgi:hypothetical protein